MRTLPLAALLLAAGCAPTDEADPAAPSDAVAAEPADTTAADDGLPADLLGLNLQTNHATGSVLRVVGVRFANDHIAVDLEFTNGADFEQELNAHSGNRFVLRDDLGNVYNLSPPPNNGDVAVPAGQNVAGEFVFLGRIHPDATQVTLVTNEQHGGNEDFSRSPKMTLQIPIAS